MMILRVEQGMGSIWRMRLFGLSNALKVSFLCLSSTCRNSRHVIVAKDFISPEEAKLLGFS